MNRPERTSAGLAAAIGAMLEPEVDVVDVLAHLVVDCASAVSADAVALLARDTHGELSLLAASSHEATQMELLQIQRETGPCVDVLAGGRPLRVAGASRIGERWDQVGAAIVAAGFAAVAAYPMRWRGTVLGGLNLFFADPDPSPASETCQAFADVATLVLVQSGAISEEHVLARIHETLSARGLVEQAKGVLAYREGVDLAEAYRLLLRRSESAGTPLTQTARAVVDETIRAR